MKQAEARTLVRKLTSQLCTAFQRIEQMEKEGLLGLEHTAMREQINATCKTLDWMKDELGHTAPFYPVLFNEFTELIGNAKKKFGWFGHL